MSDTSARDTLRDQARDNARERDNAMSVAAISSERIEPDDNGWTRRLVLFLRVMAIVSIVKGLYHWAQVTGFIGGGGESVEKPCIGSQDPLALFALIPTLPTPWPRPANALGAG